MKRRFRLSLFVGVIATALSGCASLPTSGEPHEFAIEAPQREPVHQFGAAPEPGSSPTVLVEDFLRASAAGMYDDFAAARLYLTPEASVRWHPDSQVAVFASDFTPRPEVREKHATEIEVSLELTTVGTVNEQGVLSASATPGSVNRNFTLVQNDEGEWRISKLDDGVILAQPTFNNAYQAVNLFFPSPDLSALVPDPRWYPRTRLSAYLVRGLINGPSEVLMPAVVGTLAAGLSLPTAGVEVAGRVAEVNLEGPPPTAGADRDTLNWQISQTLMQVPSVQSVEIRLNGVLQDSAETPLGPEYRLDRAVGILDDTVVVGSAAVVKAVADPQLAGPNPANPAIGPVEDSPVAWVNEGSGLLRIMRIGASAPREVEISNPGSPSIDRYGAVWVPSTEQENTIWVVPEGADPIPLSLAFDGSAEKVMVSPDGARLLVLTRGDAGAQIVLATISRSAADGQLALTPSGVLGQFSDDIADATWVGETTIAALASSSGSDSTVELLSLGGWMQTAGAPTGVDHITGVATIGSLMVQRPDGATFQRAGAAWIELSTDVRQFSYAG